VVRMASDNLLKRTTLDVPARGLVEKIQRAAQDMEELTEVLLLLAREHEGLLATEFVSVNEIIGQDLNRCRMVFGEKGLSLNLHEESNLRVRSSPKIVAMVFGNLLRNACAYTDRGLVTVSIVGHCVTITDSGVGMSKEHLGGIFKPYFNPQMNRGNGIGLSLVKRITERFDWHIDIESEQQLGTRVTVTLPAAECHETATNSLRA